MQQHPVPQPITSYEFRLVGDMTLKQFAKLAVGAILALIVYGINPPALLKWILILLFGGTGVLAAFFPFEGRPIDTWVIAFFKRIYSPTQYVWRQKSLKPQINPVNIQENIQVSVKPVEENKTPPVQTVLQSQSLKVEKEAKKPVVEQPKIVNVFQSPTIEIKTSPPPVQPKTNFPKVEAKFAPSTAMPTKPAIPNLLTGFVHDPEGKIIEGAILEIRDSGGIPVRAFKTNKLGQFQSATPLPSGNYEIETEKEGFKFDIIKIELKGEILAPIEIVSK
ncbi:MAG: hypothetical protein ACOX50_02020 [Patescibacteria group bacterium]|jgi:hypothetical protein